jgi:cytochrome o ubiquinol oxidase subunit IV
MSDKVIVARHDTTHGSVRSYTIGFVLSIVLTLIAFWMVNSNVSSGWTLVISLGVLAIAQLFVQLIFFLHLGRESKPRWNLSVLLFAAMVVIILVFGSIWIMKNLEYHHGQQISEEKIIKDEGYDNSHSDH